MDTAEWVGPVGGLLGSQSRGAPSRSLYTVILQAFQSLWMERQKEKLYSPGVSDLPPDEG